MQQTIPYTYLIGWPEHNVWYYGVRYANGCTPSDLWVKYKTSSKYVKHFALTHGDPSVIQVRRRFSSSLTARRWEATVLRRLGVVTKTHWLNKHDAISIDPSTVASGEQHWTYNNVLHSQQWTGDNNPMHRPDILAKVSGDNHYTRQPDYDNSNHPLKRAAVKAAIKPKISGDNHYTHQPDYDNSNHPMKRQENREKLAARNRARAGTKHTVMVCEHYGASMASNNFPKFHGDNCKHLQHK